MKPTKHLLFLLSFLTTVLISQSQVTDSTGLPGDDFSLQGALEMFKKASSPEEFEKMINTEDNAVNNLDLNEDGDIDYVRVIDKSEKDAHAFVLQVPVSENENQDIAVIELEKTGEASAIVQIIGDEDIYGEEVIVEPNSDAVNAVVANVWFWPTVRFVYRPAYVVWYSPWKWHHYPGWWRPWRPLPWRVYHPMRMHYYRPFAVVHTHRVIHAHRIYTPVRVTSVTVRTRHQASINNYRVTRRTTTVTGPRGNQVSRKTTTVKGPRGNTRIKSSKTTVRRKR